MIVEVKVYLKQAQSIDVMTTYVESPSTESTANEIRLQRGSTRSLILKNHDGAMTMVDTDNVAAVSIREYSPR